MRTIPAQGTATAPTVLLVDDDPLFRRLVRMTIPTEDVTVVEAADGTEAIRLARIRRPSLIFLDVYLPDVDGFEVCRQPRADPATTAARIVMLTSAQGKADRALAGMVSADDYLIKPFSPLMLLQLIYDTVSVA